MSDLTFTDIKWQNFNLEIGWDVDEDGLEAVYVTVLLDKNDRDNQQEIKRYLSDLALDEIEQILEETLKEAKEEAATERRIESLYGNSFKQQLFNALNPQG